MKVKWLPALLAIAVTAGETGAALADHRRHHDEKWEDEYWDGPCRVKEVADGNQYKKEIKCPDGRGRSWKGGEWKREFRDGPCRVKIEAKRDEYKEESKCEGWDD